MDAHISHKLRILRWSTGRGRIGIGVNAAAAALANKQNESHFEQVKLISKNLFVSK